MRRMIKEDLKKFDGSDLFPPRVAHTVPFKLSPVEHRLYEDVTDYVRNQFNRAAQAADGRKRTVGFALTVLQRRLASSPEAIYLSLSRRRKRLEEKLKDARKVGRVSRDSRLDTLVSRIEDYDQLGIGPSEVQEFNDADEVEETEEEVLDLATAARTIRELEAEIYTLKDLEEQARKQRAGNQDRKWVEIANLIQNKHLGIGRSVEARDFNAPPGGERPKLSRNQRRKLHRYGKIPAQYRNAGSSFEDVLQDQKTLLPDQPTGDADPHPRRLIVFTEHKDTLNYLERKLVALRGEGWLVKITGSMNRQARKAAQEKFLNDPGTSLLLATDAASEGVNLQRASLMVNYDLPWNPNRLEQRFGRIHRIGQTEECHVWNLVAEDTREGQVYRRLLEKLEAARKALGGKVFDVLGDIVPGTLPERPPHGRGAGLAELHLGNDPRDVSKENRGYDIESKDKETGRLRMIEVKGRVKGATTVTITRNEIVTALNKPKDFILALVEVDGEHAADPRYVRRPFDKEPCFTEVSANHDLKKLLERSTTSE